MTTATAKKPTTPRDKGLTDTALKSLKARDKAYKVTDRDGMYVTVSPAGTIAFRYDYRLSGQRETLTIGKYDPTLSAKSSRVPDQLSYGMGLSLAEARTLLARARRDVDNGVSPSRAKAAKRTEATNAETFGHWVEAYFAFKADPKSGEEQLADSTLAMRRSNYKRLLEKPIGSKKLDEIQTEELGRLFKKIKDERGPGPAVHARELVLLVYRHAQGWGKKVENPAEAIERKLVGSFEARERNLNRHEIKTFFEHLHETATAPSLRIAVRFVLRNMVRKGEFVGAKWSEINWERATWTIPPERSKNGKEHVVYLSEQSIDELETLRALYPSSVYLHPSRYDSRQPISDATLNRTIEAAVKRINSNLPESAEPFAPVSVHDLRRTASTRLNDALFPEPLIEACLAHVKKDKVAAAYNHAKLAGPRRELMQAWSDMIDAWCRGESAKDIIRAAKDKIADAAHDDAEMDL